MGRVKKHDTQNMAICMVILEVIEIVVYFHGLSSLPNDLYRNDRFLMNRKFLPARIS